MDEIVFLAIVFVPLACYFWFRFGPPRCPGCGRLTFGYAGTPIGVRWMHFHCQRCGRRFAAHPRLPL
jgi:hypothetical protein